MTNAAPEPLNEPPNVPASFEFKKVSDKFEISYEGKPIFQGTIASITSRGFEPVVQVRSEVEKGTRSELTQKIIVECPPNEEVELNGLVYCSDEAFPAETDSPAQARFKMVRNSVGLSSNTRNNAIYDRKRDWMLEGAGDHVTTIIPMPSKPGHTTFQWETRGNTITLTFRPKYYQLHKNIAYFRPWEHPVWKGSVTGWCSWWAYFSDVREQDVARIASIFGDKLKDFGYRYIQIDDGYQSSGGGLPKDWLTTNDHFPGGLASLAKTISNQGLSPALWLNVHFGDEKFVDEHPSWFIQDANGKPHKGPWIDYGLDGSNKEAVDAVVRPTYRALHSMGWKYIKVDALRHLLYDSTYPCRDFFTKRGIVPEDAYRDYLKAIRQELGPDTYILACWGVLPETVGLVDGCRLGGDGFGPSTLQQYTSWNNVVWRNDPDHCDIEPLDRNTGKYVAGEERLRPVLVSMAGAQLLLSDKPDVYENDANLEGAKRSSPILFTRPGQLYDYDPVKTDHLKEGLRNTNGGAQAGPIDADQKGEVCPWWMLDINEPYESWSVLTRMDWHDTPMPRTQVSFDDLGLLPLEYAVFEFWSKKYLGDFTNGFTAAALDPKGLATYAIRRTENHPQILSTSRHISQGAAELEGVKWDDVKDELSGSSRLVRNDPYSIYVRMPAGYSIKDASFGGAKADLRVEGGMAIVSVVPSATRAISWRIEFKRS